MTHTNPFAPDPQNLFTKFSDSELQALPGAGNQAAYAEELSRREDLDRAVSLWERLCAVPFVRGETQGEYQYSTRYLDPAHTQPHGLGAVSRMPNREELEALVLSDGEETAYPAHDVTEPSGYVWRQDTSPWSTGDRLYPITLTLISCGDYHGSDVDAANNRALDGTPGVTVREPDTGGQGSVFNVSTTVVGEMSSFENATNPGDTEREPAERRADALMWLEHLVDMMEGLTEYGLLDDETHSELIDELAEKAWDDHLSADTFDRLADNAPSDTEEDRVEAQRAYEESDALVHAAYFAFEGNEWNVSSLGEGATNARHGEAVKHVARTVFGWRE